MNPLLLILAVVFIEALLFLIDVVVDLGVGTGTFVDIVGLVELLQPGEAVPNAPVEALFDLLLGDLRVRKIQSLPPWQGPVRRFVIAFDVSPHDFDRITFWIVFRKIAELRVVGPQCQGEIGKLVGVIPKVPHQHFLLVGFASVLLGFCFPEGLESLRVPFVLIDPVLHFLAALDLQLIIEL